INNFGYASAVEKLLGIDVTDRCKYIRVIMSEISRICDHLTCVGASAMELGAFTVFLYMIKAREFLWELVEDVTGARLTISYGRVGGVKADLPAGFDLKMKKAFGEVRQGLGEGQTPSTANRVCRGGGGARAALTTTSVGRSPTGPMTACSSRCRWARTETTSTASSCAWPRWSRPCASPSRGWRACPAAPSRWTGKARPSIRPRMSISASRGRRKACCSYPSSSRRISRGRAATPSGG